MKFFRIAVIAVLTLGAAVWAASATQLLSTQYVNAPAGNGTFIGNQPTTLTQGLPLVHPTSGNTLSSMTLTVYADAGFADQLDSCNMRAWKLNRSFRNNDAGVTWGRVSSLDVNCNAITDGGQTQAQTMLIPLPAGYIVPSGQIYYEAVAAKAQSGTVIPVQVQLEGRYTP